MGPDRQNTDAFHGDHSLNGLFFLRFIGGKFSYQTDEMKKKIPILLPLIYMELTGNKKKYKSFLKRS